MEWKTTTYLANLLQSCIDNKSYLSGKILHARILRIGLFSYTFLSNRLIEFYSKCSHIHAAQSLFDITPQRDVYSWNAILGVYSKIGKLQDAHELFVRMPERNIVSWNTLITALVRTGFEKKALDVYDTMIWEGFIPTHFTLASVFSACGAILDIERGRRSHGIAIKIGLDKNMYVGNALLGMYAKCGLITEAFRIFEEIAKPNEVTFTAMMGGLSQTERVTEALHMFRLMCRNGICVDSVSLSSLLGVCARGGCGESSPDDRSDGVLCDMHGQQVHGLSIKLGFVGDLHLSNSLLDMYAKNGDMDSAELIFANLPEISVVSWNIMITGFGQKYQSEKAMEYFHRMQCCGFEPDEVTYINALTACLKSGDMESARQMFDGMMQPSLSSWNAMLSGYSQKGDDKEAIKLFREMQFRNVHLDRTTLAIILSSSAGQGLHEAGKQLHAASLKADLHTDIYVASGLIGMYSKCRKIDIAQSIFFKLPELDIVCWNSMMVGLSHNSLDEEAFTFFKKMQQNGMFPTQFSYATVLSCCAKLSYSFQGRQIHSQIEKHGFRNDAYVGSSLIEMYCRCGEVDSARQFFDTMLGKTVVTWNEMIHGYAQNGQGDEAMGLYNDMLGSGEKPDAITFVAVLTACSHSGLVDEGIKIFHSMQQKHGVDPLVDHYTCIIDSLGRAGRFHEAELLLEQMPYKDDQVIWEVVLSSCRVHANVTLAKRAAEELFRLEPRNSSPYVLLANIYSSLGRWDDVRAVRELMSVNQVVKDPGYSWTEYTNGTEASMMG